jgi:nucleotide-binding universal stress UspA family protein
MTLDRVLVSIGPNDREHVERLTDTAIDIAGDDTTVYLLHVFTEDEYEKLSGLTGEVPTTETPSPDELAARHESIQGPVDRIDAHGLEYEVRGVAGGEATEQVLRKLDELGADQVVIGGEQRSPTGKAMFGDHAQEILLNAPCPVTYVRRE